MYSLSNKHVGSSCELYTLDNTLMTNGKLTRIGDDFIEVTNSLGVMSLRKYEERVKCVIKTAQGDVVIEGRLYLPNMESFRIIDMDCLADNDKREFFRVQLTENCIISKRTHDGRKGMDFGVKMLDLSIGGCQLHSSLAFEKGQTIVVGLRINDEIIRVDGTIVRVVSTPSGGYNYGVRFEDTGDRNSDIICQYLFKKQKDTINEIKEKAK